MRKSPRPRGSADLVYELESAGLAKDVVRLVEAGLVILVGFSLIGEVGAPPREGFVWALATIPVGWLAGWLGTRGANGLACRVADLVTRCRGRDPIDDLADVMRLRAWVGGALRLVVFPLLLLLGWSGVALAEMGGWAGILFAFALVMADENVWAGERKAIRAARDRAADRGQSR